MSDIPLTHLSLFSGYGGLDIAAHWAGFTTVGLCEFAPYPQELLKKRFPEVHIWGDIRTLTGDSFYEHTGLRTAKLISGGFPCQPFSVAGKQLGTDDPRYLWPEMLRVITEIKPTWVICENVAGLTSMAQPTGDFNVDVREHIQNPDEDNYYSVLSRQEKMLLYSILQDLEKEGYTVQSFLVPAAGANAPHWRYRIAIVGYAEYNGPFATA